MDVLVRLFKSVANEKRVLLLETLLEKGEMRLDDLAFYVKLPYKTVSRNLKILEKSMLVKHRTRKGKVYYSIEGSSPLFYEKTLLKLIRHQQIKRQKRA